MAAQPQDCLLSALQAVREGAPLYPAPTGYIFSEILDDRHRLRRNDLPPPSRITHGRQNRLELNVQLLCFV